VYHFAIMDTTFISIHDLSEDLTTLYSSDSVIDVLQYTPDELVARSAWELFHPDELPLARWIHGKKVAADKAAVLAYCRIKNKAGEWIGCECCFSVVYDVMIACTSVYKRGLRSQKRALEAPLVRRCFSSSPADPRYHMLQHISSKFTQSLGRDERPHEPRAALFLNRFTRTLSIMYATAGLKEVIGIPAEEMRGRSFYYCIAEDCLTDAVRCLENAKGNNSIAYLRFWFRDPRVNDDPPPPDESDEDMTNEESEDDIMADSTDSDDPDERALSRNKHNELSRAASRMDLDDDDDSKSRSRNSSGESSRAADSHEAIFGTALAEESSASSPARSPSANRRSVPAIQREPIELEAVISCASDGLVVCLRRARPIIPGPTQRSMRPRYSAGLFAAPWADEPILPYVGGTGTDSQANPTTSASHLAAKSAHVSGSVTTAEQQGFMQAIRDQAIFAWAITGINGALYEHKIGTPMGESLPADGISIWTNDVSQPPSGTQKSTGSHSSQETVRAPPQEQQQQQQQQQQQAVKPNIGPQIFGDPGQDSKFLYTKSGSKQSSG